ncbi:MAG: TetR/AcrR family transcriptional regulator [Sphingomonadaceae bacterium]|nr:TetR/AcrR family transcriptional regulator [Sphingomonadaceae bacterium]
MATRPAPRPRPARTSRTRAALLTAGLDLMVERPIDAIPIDDFVAAAGVAKGSFFNHFADKKDFAIAVAEEVRMAVEMEVAAANAGIADPVERIAGGMRVAARFALDHPRRTVVLLRSQTPATARAHPRNKGLKQDIDAACEQVLYWLGLCQILVINLVEQQPGPAEAAQRLSDMLVLGLTGLGVPTEHAAALACPSRHLR